MLVLKDRKVSAAWLGKRPVSQMWLGQKLVWRKKAARTARDYVQDGLIALYDGEENAGWGSHASQAMEWKNLVGDAGTAMAITDDGVSWEGNYLSLPNSCPYNTQATSAVQLASWMTGGTVEICASFAQVEGDDYVYSNVQHPVRLGAALMPASRFHRCSMIGWTGNGTRCIISQQEDPALPESSSLDVPRTISVQGGTTDPGQKAMYVDGTPYLVEMIRPSNPFDDVPAKQLDVIRCGMADVRLYSVRVYSRSLSPAEIAANHQVDDARFVF